jgi:UDP-galactopyranose mutase
MAYDYLIVGAGMFGATFARLATDAGKSCLVIDKRQHIGGNCYTENIEGINVHKYGAHIFHTSEEAVWRFVNRFTEFNNYVNSPKAIAKGKVYSLPINMNTFYELWGTRTPDEAKRIIDGQKFTGTPTNMEELALSLVGGDIYQTLVRGYTEKQWGRPPSELPPLVFKRIPLRFTYDNNYFNDRYQGIPIGGYTKMFERMLEGVEVRPNTDYLADTAHFNSLARKVVFTGCLDEFFNYEFGELEYRSLDFKHEIKDTSNYQGNAVFNYCDREVPYTRVLEHKHFEKIDSDKTVVTHEFPTAYNRGMIPYYPINDEKNHARYLQYKAKASTLPNFILGGRLAEYRYMDMEAVIRSAMDIFGRTQ